MKLSQRVKLAFNALTSKALYNSIDGAVVRNLFEDSKFNPQAQVRGITFKAIDKIGMAMSMYDPQAVKVNGDIYVNHPIITLAKNPNPQTNSSDFNHLWAMLYEIYGETFWYLVRGEVSRKVKEVYLLNPAQMELRIDNGELVGYILHKANGQQIPFELDEIIHDKRPNPFNNWRGMSVLERASLYVDTEIITSQFTLSYMRNNASPSGIVSLPNMDKNAFQQFTQQWRENYEGPNNAGKTAFIRGEGADFKAVGATLRDVDQKVTRDMAKEDVLMMLEVPKPLLGISEQSGLGRASVETLHYIFNKEKIDPYMERLDRIWEKVALIGGLGVELKDIQHVSPIPENREFILDRNVKGVNKWITINEARELDGLEPIEGGDVLREITSTMPIIESATNLTTKKVTLKAVTVEKEKDTTIKDYESREQFRSRLVKVNDVYGRKIKTTIAKFAKKQEDKVIANINLAKKEYEEWLPSVKEESIELEKLITPIILALMVEQSEGVANFITGEPMVVTAELKRNIQARILKIAGLYNEETVKALEKTIAEGVTNGESLVKIKKRVEAKFEEAKGYRAERIARTESLRASNGTAEEVYKQNGFSTVTWFANPGACEFCQEMDGKTKTIGSSFYEVGDVIHDVTGEKQMQIDYDDIGTPPLHPQCACSIVPED